MQQNQHSKNKVLVKIKKRYWNNKRVNNNRNCLQENKIPRKSGNLDFRGFLCKKNGKKEVCGRSKTIDKSADVCIIVRVLYADQRQLYLASALGREV